jgi:hypothetical protein
LRQFSGKRCILFCVRCEMLSMVLKWVVYEKCMAYANSRVLLGDWKVPIHNIQRITNGILCSLVTYLGVCFPQPEVRWILLWVNTTGNRNCPAASSEIPIYRIKGADAASQTGMACTQGVLVCFIKRVMTDTRLNEKSVVVTHSFVKHRCCNFVMYIQNAQEVAIIWVHLFPTSNWTFTVFINDV